MLYFQELESLFSEHFGRTPATTPAASQELPVSDSEGESDTDVAVDVDERSRRYADQVIGTDSGSSSDSDTEQPDINDNLQQEDDPDVSKVRKYLRDGCGCKAQCAKLFSEQTLYFHILNMREMTKEEKELYIMGALSENDRESTKRGKKRLRMRHSLTFSGHRVCRSTFLLAFDIGKHTLKGIKDHVQEHGVSARSHKNTGRKPPHALVFEDIKRVVQFINNYSEEHGLPQPAAPRGLDDIPPVFLSSDTTRKRLHELYVTSCTTEETVHRSVKYSTFCNIWNHCLPHVKIAKPKDDVCSTCEKLRKLIMDSVTEEEKLESTLKMQEHIHKAQEERGFYNDCVKRARDTFNGENKFVHYTFDYSQNLTLPHHAHQMGPLYFLSLRKVQLFGFRVDGQPKQLNFLIDENQTIGYDGSSTHGPDAVISMIDWAMHECGQGETECTIHADNCGAQNKNQFILGYFMWRILTGQHEKITYSMQVPGHARCLIDGGFGLIKKLYRRSDCDDLKQLETVVNRSSQTNVSVLYPSWQWRSWKQYLSENFKPVKGIRKYQHFVFQKNEPGVVTVKQSVSGVEEKVNILKVNGHGFDAQVKPPVLNPLGLTEARQSYLYRSVRPYVRPGHQDYTCPPLL